MPRTAAIALALVAALAAPARADIAYDSITGHPGAQWLFSGNTELADDTVLAPGAGLLITAITIRARESTINLTYIGSLRVSLYADAAGVPGTLLTTRTIPITLLPAQPPLNVVVDVPDVLASSPLLWTGIMFEFPGVSNGTPSLPFGGTPVVGISSEFYAHRTGGLGPWTLGTDFNGFAIRIESIPAPATPALIAAAILFARRRRGPRPSTHTEIDPCAGASRAEQSPPSPP